MILKRRLFSLLTACMMLLNIMPFSAYADVVGSVIVGPITPSKPPVIGLLALEVTPAVYYGNIGDTAVFTVKEPAEGCTYQWTRCGSVNDRTTGAITTFPSLNDGFYEENAQVFEAEKMIIEENAASISIPITEESIQYIYKCTEIKDSGSLSSGELYIVTPLSITSQPQNYVAELNDTASFTVEASGATKYQWQVSTGSGWTDISSENSGTLNVHVTADVISNTYRCKITNPDETIYTDEVCIESANKMEIVSQPVDFTGKVGDIAEFRVAASGVTSYQWQQDTGNGWSDISTSAGRSPAITVPLSIARLRNSYRCVLSNGFDTVITNEVKLILDEELAITSQPVNFSGKIGDVAKFTVEATGAASYQWQQNTGKGWADIATSAGRSKSISVALSTARLNYSYRCVISNGTDTITTNEVKLILDEELAITSQPVDFSGKIGDVAKFTVEATGAASYQWQQNTGKGWSDIATSAGRSKSISVSLTVARLKYSYRCVISNGTETITTNEVKLILDEELAITSQPANFAGKIGDVAKFTVEATGAASYQWQQNTGKGWSDIATSAGRSKSISVALSTARLKYSYRCVISNGTDTITTNEVKLILDEELTITSQPANFAGKIGDVAKFTVEATGAASYQWQQNTGKGWSDIATSAGRSKSISVTLSTARLNYSYRCVISNGTDTITTNEVKLILDEELAITSQPVNFSGKIGDVAKFTVEATGAASYQWQQNTGKGWSDIATSAGRSKSISVSLTVARLKYSYRCVISNGTDTITTNEVKLILDEELAITSQPANFIGNIGDTARFTVEATGALSYQWQQDTGKGWTDINVSAARNKTLAIVVSEARLNYSYRCVISNGAETVTSDAVRMISKGTVAESISSYIDAETLCKGSVYQIYTTATPSDAVVDLKYRASNDKVEIDENGVITPVSTGPVRIYVEDTISGISYSVVKKIVATPLSVSGIVLPEGSMHMCVGDSKPIIYSFLPIGAAADVEYTLDENNKAALTIKDGVATAGAEGETTVTLTANGKSASIKVIVHPEGSRIYPDITLNKTVYNVKAGEYFNIDYSVNTDYPMFGFNWMSADYKIVSVNKFGSAYARAAGHSQISVLDPSDSSILICDIYVSEADATTDEEILIDSSSKLNLTVGDKISFDDMDVSVAPENYYDKLQAVSYNPLIIDKAGNEFVAKNAGTAEIRIYIPNTASRTITVNVSKTEADDAEDRLAYAYEVLRYVNIEREKEGLDPLELDLKLSGLAQIRAEECISQYSHIRPDGTSWYTVFYDTEYQERLRGENLFKTGDGPISAEQTVEIWMSSPTHAANILNSRYKYIGVGSVLGIPKTYTDIVSYITTQLFTS